MKIRRRELAAIMLLHKLYGPGRVNLGLVVDVLRSEMGVTGRTAVNIVRRLRKLGFLAVLKDERGLYVELRNPCTVLEGHAMDYVRSRKERGARPRGTLGHGKAG